VSERLIYRCSPSIVWVKDASQTMVVDKETGQSWVVRGAEALVWDLVTVGYSYHRIIRMLSLILSLSVEEGDRILAGVMRQWQDAGIVQVSGEAADGKPDHQYGM
jgi:hypothetical protein